MMTPSSNSGRAAPSPRRNPRPKLTEIERRILALAAAMARPGEPLCNQDFAELLEIKAWQASDRIHALRASHPALWPWKSYPNGARANRHHALRNEQRERGRAFLAAPEQPGGVAPGSLRVLQLVARIRRARLIHNAELVAVEVSRGDCRVAAEALERVASGEPAERACVLRDVAARLRAAAVWNVTLESEGAPR